VFLRLIGARPDSLHWRFVGHTTGGTDLATSVLHNLLLKRLAKPGAKMTEQQREEEFLSELLDLYEDAEGTQAAAVAHGAEPPQQPALTRSEERELLKVANQVGTPILTPQKLDFTQGEAPRSFASDVAGLVRKYPIPALLAGIGIAYLLTRQRR
jgi:hypothetical protein